MTQTIYARNTLVALHTAQGPQHVLAFDHRLHQIPMYMHFKSKAALFKAIIEMEHSKGAAKATQSASVAPYLAGILAIMADCIRGVSIPVDHRLWTEILAVAGRDTYVREVFAVSDKAMRTAFVELLQKAALAGEIDSGLDFNAVSVWLYVLNER